MRGRKITAGIIEVGVVVVFFGWVGWTVLNQFNRVEEGENVAHVDWLPAEASRISFYRSYTFTACEFSIDRAGFLRWAKEKGWKVEAVGEEPFRVLRYLLPHQKEAAGRGEFEHMIRKGLCYVREQSNGGGVWAGYDEEEGRAYMYSTPR